MYIDKHLTHTRHQRGSGQRDITISRTALAYLSQRDDIPVLDPRFDWRREMIFVLIRDGDEGLRLFFYHHHKLDWSTIAHMPWTGQNVSGGDLCWERAATTFKA